MLGAVALSSCNDNFERPPMVYPSADITANATVDELKTRYWQDDRNYVAVIGELNELTGKSDDAGTNAIISGRVN